MTWYAYYETSGGKLVSLGTTADDPAIGITRVDVGEIFPVGVWNQSTLQFDPAPPPRIISRKDFRDRFSDQEFEDFIAFSEGNGSNANKVRSFKEHLNQDDHVELDSAYVIASMAHLEAPQVSVLSSGRAAEILA